MKASDKDYQIDALVYCNVWIVNHIGLWIINKTKGNDNERTNYVRDHSTTIISFPKWITHMICYACLRFICYIPTSRKPIYLRPYIFRLTTCVVTESFYIPCGNNSNAKSVEITKWILFCSTFFDKPQMLAIIWALYAMPLDISAPGFCTRLA